MTIKTPFMLASEIEYYAHALLRIATDKDVVTGQIPRSDDQITVQRYNEKGPNQYLMSAQIAREIGDLFCDAANMGIAEDDHLTRDKLKGSIETLTKIVEMADPAEGHVTCFSNLQRPLEDQMIRVGRYAQDLKIDQ